MTPDYFKFTAKFPKRITHVKRLGEGAESDMKYFHKAMTPLARKLGCLLIQLPPSLSMKEGMNKIQKLPFDKGFRYAIEVRHKSWFDDEFYSFLKDNDICLAWSQLKDIQTPIVVTTDFIYLRLMGDRSIPEEEFGTIQKDRTIEMKAWAAILNKLTKDKNQKNGFVPISNHYAGFAPATANMFRKFVGLQPVFWEEMKQAPVGKQNERRKRDIIPVIKTIDEYIKTFPKDVQGILEKMRQTIKTAAPEATEAISYQMPTFKLNGKNLVHFAAFKNHIGFYPIPSGIEAFRKELSPYKQGKGSVQFPINRPIPHGLVKKIAIFRVNENLLQYHSDKPSRP